MSKAKELIESLKAMSPTALPTEVEATVVSPETVETTVEQTPEIEESNGGYTHDTMGKVTTVHHNGYKIGQIVHRGGDKHIATAFQTDGVRTNKEVNSKEKGVNYIAMQHQKNKKKNK